MYLIRRFHIYERDCAMHGAWEFQTPWGWVVFQPPVKSFGERRKWYLFLSSDATPAAATWGFGPGFARCI